MEEKDTDFTKEENVELNSVYLKRNIAIAVCLVLYIAIFLGCGAWISMAVHNANDITIPIFVTCLLSITTIIINISTLVHYQSMIIKAKRNDKIRHDEKVRFKERERLEHQKYDAIYNEIYEKVKKEFEEKK